jgi:hypothetical protein
LTHIFQRGACSFLKVKSQNMITESKKIRTKFKKKNDNCCTNLQFPENGSSVPVIVVSERDDLRPIFAGDQEAVHVLEEPRLIPLADVVDLRKYFHRDTS